MICAFVDSAAGSTYLGQETGRSDKAAPITNKGEKVKASVHAFSEVMAINPCVTRSGKHVAAVSAYGDYEGWQQLEDELDGELVPARLAKNNKR